MIFCTIHLNQSVDDSLIHWFTELKTEWIQPVMLPFGHSLFQLSQQVLVKLVELRQVVEDLVKETLLDHRLSFLTRCCGHSATEVLQGQKTTLVKKGTWGKQWDGPQPELKFCWVMTRTHTNAWLALSTVSEWIRTRGSREHFPSPQILMRWKVLKRFFASFYGDTWQ